jgi:phosphatidylglycerophosphatase A
MNPETEPATLSAGKKPRLAILLATGFGLGYLPKAPGTWGSLGGLALVWCLCQFIPDSFVFDSPAWTRREFLELLIVVAPLLAILGVWAAGRAARYLAAKDPQIVVIDEISGQLITFFGGPPVGHIFFGFSLAQVARVPRWPTPVNWKYLLLGFILFRVFDIWKPFPARQAEALPGGWGIMADDWVAGVYAALGLWLARALGL